MNAPEENKLFDFIDKLKLQKTYYDFKKEVYWFITSLPFDRVFNVNSFFMEAKEPKRRQYFIEILEYLAGRGFCCFDIEMNKEEDIIRFRKIEKFDMFKK